MMTAPQSTRSLSFEQTTWYTAATASILVITHLAAEYEVEAQNERHQRKCVRHRDRIASKNVAVSAMTTLVYNIDDTPSTDIIVRNDNSYRWTTLSETTADFIFRTGGLGHGP